MPSCVIELYNAWDEPPAGKLRLHVAQPCIVLFNMRNACCFVYAAPTHIARRVDVVLGAAHDATCVPTKLFSQRER